jgi:hypothetical protein
MKANSDDQKKRPNRPTKKNQIIALFMTGINEMDEISRITKTRPSYVASVLQQAGLISGYFDLYTPTSQPLNIYSRFFAGKLGFKNEETSQNSVELIDKLYRQFAFNGDRAGQHHALMMALTMYNRARWTNKPHEADIFRNWIIQRLEENEHLADEEE